MMSFQNIFSLLLVSTTVTNALPWPHTQQQAGGIEWSRCETMHDLDVNLTCAELEVPLDYMNRASNETLTLKLVRHAATKQPFEGTVLYNPGGPGAAGRNSLYGSTGDLLHSVVGHRFDLVSWDPRGSGDTLPFACFRFPNELSTYTANGLGMAINASEVGLGNAWATQEYLSNLCEENPYSSRIGGLIGTSFTARNMMQIVDALDEDGMLRLWGISYGSVLGQTAAAMFPERVDKLVLDGVLNPSEYWAGLSVSEVTDTDKTFDSFLDECLRTPRLCPLAARATSKVTLSKMIYDLFEDLKYQPAVIGTFPPEHYGVVKTKTVRLLYNTLQWPSLSKYLDAILTQNETEMSEYLAMEKSSTTLLPFPDFSPSELGVHRLGIRCSDESLRSGNLASLLPLLDAWQDESSLAGDLLAAQQTLACAQWPFRAKERYTGKFQGIQTNNPILFVGSSYDPITSMEGARNASAAFVNSRLLIHDSHGHGSRGQQSTCTDKIIGEYFLNGTLPNQGTICEPSVPAFMDTTAKYAFQPRIYL